RGDIELPMYRAYLEQLYLVHKKLEELLRQHKKGDHVIGNAVNDEQMQENFLAHDLRALGGDPSKVKAVPATERLLRLMSEYSERQPISLLGLHYVLLGSKHGGKYIAHQLQKNYELEAGAGNKY